MTELGVPAGDIREETAVEWRQHMMDLRAWQVADHQNRLAVGLYYHKREEGTFPSQCVLETAFS